MAKVVALASDKANPIIVNPLTCIWQMINTSQLLSHSFPEFLKLAEIVTVHVLGFVEDEHCFSFACFLKTKLCNFLDPHLELAIAMFSQKFFSYLITFLTLPGCGWFMVKCSPCKWPWQICMKYKFWNLDRFLEEHMLQHDRAQVVNPSSDVAKIWRLVYSP
jgi:hypothetical protein